MLLIATGVLVAFILGLGDFRRQRYALAQLRLQANNYERRIGAGGVMPLNFDPDVLPGGQKMIPLESLDRQAAAMLRAANGPILVAQTVPILQVFGREGRAVMTFHKGKFAVEWMTLPSFEALLNAQKELMARLAAEKAADTPASP